MAITNKNVENVKFLRNGNLYNNHDAAFAALKSFDITGEQDGIAILARYNTTESGTTVVKTLVGWVYSGATGHYITIQDVDGASADVNELRTEINNKLGSGIGSGSSETVTAQLTALSGNNQSTSTDTSVEGAKRYADELKNQMEYTGVTTGTGVYVTNVTETDGIISATTATLPTVGPITEAGKPIIAVAEDKGTISASAGTINAEYVNVTGSVFSSTTVQGALEEIDGEYKAAIEDLDYSGITTSDAAVVTNVTETNGKVSATSANVGGLKLTDYTKGSDSGSVDSNDSINQAIAKLENQIDAEKDAREAAISGLDYTDTAVAKQFVAAVNETDGVISITRGELQSSGKTINITASGNNVNFEANVDGSTIIIDENTGVMSVASSALVQYEGDDDTIQIGAVSDGKRIVSSPLTIQKVTTGLSAEVKEEYRLIGHSGNTIGEPVKIYKDSHIVSIKYISGSTDPHYQNLEYVYIDASGNTSTTYVDMSELVLEAEFASGITVTDHIVHGVVDTDSESFLTVGANGFKLSGVQNAINSAVNGLDATVSNSGTSGHVGVEVVEENGKLTAITVSENDIASQAKLNELSGKTITEVESSNFSISAETAATTNGTVKVDVTTDASKIKMTGFTAAESGLTAITSASTVTEAVKTIETEILANEQTTAAALNDLRTDINTVSGDVDTIKTNYVSGVSVNGSAVTVSDHVAPITIQGATSETTAATTNAIVVTTANDGTVTLGLNYIDCGVYDID